MKLAALNADHLMQITELLDQARPEQLLLDARALAKLRATLSGLGFIPLVFVGVDGGLVQGATGNCAMHLVSCDYDVDGSAPRERRFLRAFQSTGVPVEHQVAVDAEVCNALLTDALADAQACEEHPAKGMVIEALIKRAMVNDGFDVAQAPDGRWYWADEQGREEVTTGEHATASLAWRDLAEARRHVLEEADLDAAGAFLTTASSHELALQHQHRGVDSATTIHTSTHDDGEYELRVCGVGEGAYL